MDREEIHRLWDFVVGNGVLTTTMVEEFANLVAAHEREACALECDKVERRKWETVMNGGAMQGIGARDCAAAIRARGE